MVGKKAKAYHEAGHAVIGRMLGIEVLYASMLGALQDSTGPVACMRRKAYDVAADDVEALMAAIGDDGKAALAGPFAERQYRSLTKGQIERAKNNGWRVDMDNFQRFAGEIIILRQGKRLPKEGESIEVKLNSDEVDAVTLAWEGETQALVEKHWPSIQRVAAALVDRDVLYQDDIDALIAEAAKVSE
jgi:hypothetical protein